MANSYKSIKIGNIKRNIKEFRDEARDWCRCIKISIKRF